MILLESEKTEADADASMSERVGMSAVGRKGSIAGACVCVLEVTLLSFGDGRGRGARPATPKGSLVGTSILHSDSNAPKSTKKKLPGHRAKKRRIVCSRTRHHEIIGF